MKLFAKDIPSGSTELSLLAIVETLGACSLAFYLTKHPKWAGWIALYICIAPLLLLRTKASVRLGLVWYEKVVGMTSKPLKLIADKIEPSKLIWVLPYLAVMVAMAFATNLLIPIVALPVKVFATIVGFCRWHLASLSRIPANWVRQVAQTDSTVIPELLPGIRIWVTIGGGKGRGMEALAGPELAFRQIVPSGAPLISRIFYLINLSPLLVLPFAFGLLYRWALKATAVVWLPLAFLLNGVFRKRDSVMWRVRDFSRGPMAMVLLCYAIGVLVFNGLLPVIMRSVYLHAATWLKTLGVPSVLMRFFVIAPIQSAPEVLVVEAWHLAGLASAMITVALFLWSGMLRNQHESDGFSGPKDERATLRIIRALLSMRAILATYTIACGVVAFAKAADWEWAKFSVRFLP